MAKTDKTPLLEKDQKKQINELQKSTRELKDQLHDAIEKALNQDGELHKLRKSAIDLKTNSKRFFKKSRQTRISQMGCCAYSCLLLKEFFTSLKSLSPTPIAAGILSSEHLIAICEFIPPNIVINPFIFFENI